MTHVTQQYSTFTGSVSTVGSQYVLLATKWHASHIMVIKIKIIIIMYVSVISLFYDWTSLCVCLCILACFILTRVGRTK